jgi:GNAT acetyltransferase-like protein
MITWELHKPAATSPLRLDEISELRGRVLYENGRRPAFRLPTGHFADPDPLDQQAYHVVAQNCGKAIGCVRNVPITEDVTCITEQLLGRTRFAEMLSAFGVERKSAVECGRWIVEPDFRANRIGVLLAAGAVTTAHAFGFKLVFCSVGTRDKQDCILSRLGLRRVPALPLFPVPDFNDELCVMYIQPDRPMPHFAELMAEMDVKLKLKPAENPCEQVLLNQAWHMTVVSPADFQTPSEASSVSSRLGFPGRAGEMLPGSEQ